MRTTSIIRLTEIGTVDGMLGKQLLYLNERFKLQVVSRAGERLRLYSRKNKIDCFELPFEREVSLIKDVRCLLKLVGLFRATRPDIIHANTPKISLLAMIAGKLTGVPNRVYTITGLRFETTRGIQRKVLKAAEKCVIKLATNVIAEGPSVRDVVQKELVSNVQLDIIGNGSMCGVDQSVFTVLPNDQDLYLQAKREVSFSEENFYILVVGRIVKDKGIDDIIASLKPLLSKYPNLRCIFLGRAEKNNEFADMLLKEIEACDQFFYLGYRRNVENYMQFSHLLLHASLREGFPNVLLQAGATRLPVACTYVTGCRDIITDRENGLTFEAGNREQLSSNVVFAMENYAEMKRYSERLSDQVHTKYASNRINTLMSDYYTKIAGS